MTSRVEIDKRAMRSLIADCIDNLIDDKQYARLSARTKQLLRELLEANDKLEEGDKHGM